MTSRRAQLAARTAPGRVLTSASLRSVGVGLDVADRQVRAGRWQRAARGTYVVGAGALDASDRVEVASAHVAGPCGR